MSTVFTWIVVLVYFFFRRFFSRWMVDCFISRMTRIVGNDVLINCLLREKWHLFESVSFISDERSAGYCIGTTQEGPFLLRDTMVGHAAAFNVTRVLECTHCYIRYPSFIPYFSYYYCLVSINYFYKGIVCVSTFYNCEKRYILFSSFLFSYPSSY